MRFKTAISPEMAINALKGLLRVEGSFCPEKRLQEALAPVVWGRKSGDLNAAWLGSCWTQLK